MSELLIIVPARGGSKGLPGKNCKLLGGIPLLEWTAKAVQIANISHSTVILSTEDSEIADLGSQIGLDIPFIRPANLAEDDTSMVDVIIHALNWFKKSSARTFEYVMVLQPTSPFRPPNIINNAYKLIKNNKDISGIVGVKPIHRSLQTIFKLQNTNQLTPIDNRTEPAVTRRQDVTPLYTPNGAMYLIRSAALIAQRSLFCNKASAIEMDSICSIDIDDSIDWSIANSLVNAKLTWRDKLEYNC